MTFRDDWSGGGGGGGGGQMGEYSQQRKVEDKIGDMVDEDGAE